MNQKKNPFYGVLTAIITPFSDQDQIDFKAFEKLLKHQVDAKVSGVVICGTTGESPTLTEDEKKKLIRFAHDFLRSTPVKTIAGTGSNSTRDTIEFSRWANDQGVDGIMLVSPYYNRPTQDGLFAHYSEVAKAVTCPIMLYNVPGRTACEIKPSTVSALSEFSNIRSLKEASGSLVKFQEFKLAVDRSYGTDSSAFTVLSGDDPLFLPSLATGAKGIVSVASNVIPDVLVQIFDLFESGQTQKANELHLKWFPFFQALFIEPNPIPVKGLLAHLKQIQAQIRLPLTGIKAGHLEDLVETYKACGAIR